MRFTETIATGVVTDAKTGKEYRCDGRIDDDFLKLVNELDCTLNTYKSANKTLKSTLDRVRQDAFKCLDCEYSYNFEMGCMCEKQDCWIEFKTECKYFLEMEDEMCGEMK